MQILSTLEIPALSTGSKGLCTEGMHICSDAFELGPARTFGVSHGLATKLSQGHDREHPHLFERYSVLMDAETCPS